MGKQGFDVLLLEKLFVGNNSDKEKIECMRFILPTFKFFLILIFIKSNLN